MTVHRPEARSSYGGSRLDWYVIVADISFGCCKLEALYDHLQVSSRSRVCVHGDNVVVCIAQFQSLGAAVILCKKGFSNVCCKAADVGR